MAEEVGGFFASLKLNTDEASFSRGAGKISDLAGGLKGLLLAGAGLAGLTLSFKALLDAASEQAKLGQMALSLGMSADNLQNWSAAVRIAGGDADAFVSSISNLNQKMVDLRAFGDKPGDKFWIAVRGLGVNPNSMLNMNNDQRIAVLMKGAEKLAHTGPQGLQNAQTFLREALGQSGVGLLTKAMQNKTTVADLYARGAGSQFTTGADMAGASKGMTEWNQSVETLKSVFNLFSDTVMRELAPSLKGLNAWLTANKGEIAKFTKAMADLATVLLQLLGSAVFKSMDVAMNASAASSAKLGSTDQRMSSIGMERSAQALLSGILPKALNEAITKSLDESEAAARAGRGVTSTGPEWGVLSMLIDALKGGQKIVIEDRTSGGVKASTPAAAALDTVGQAR